jgi:hypothetical protein
MLVPRSLAPPPRCKSARRDEYTAEKECDDEQCN